MTAGSMKRRRDERGGQEDWSRLMARASWASDVTAQTWHRRERDGPHGDRQADGHGLAHVVARHTRVRQAHGECEGRDHDGGEDTRVAASDCPA